MSPDDPTPAFGGKQKRVLSALVEQVLVAWDEEGTRALELACEAHPEHAAGLRRRLARLLRAGLLEASSEHASEDALPKSLGPFRLGTRLGEGGMGVVFLAQDIELGRQVALKVIRPEARFLGDARERFQREVEAMAQLSHPGIVTVYQVGDEGGVPWFAMEYLDGCSLSDIVVSMEGRRPETLTGADLCAPLKLGADALGLSDDYQNAALKIVHAVAIALEHAHGRGVLHRDIKPSNVMLCRDGRVVLLDFGLARREGAESFTRTGAVLGSLPYLAPEQLASENPTLDARADVYALGVVLYELLTLRTPYQSKSTEVLLVALARRDYAGPRTWNRALGRELEAVCLHAMQPDPARRYSSCAAFASDLLALSRGDQPAVRPAGLLTRVKHSTRRRARAIAFAAVLLLLALLMVERLLEERSYEPPTHLASVVASLDSFQLLLDDRRLDSGLRRDLVLELAELFGRAAAQRPDPRYPVPEATVRRRLAAAMTHLGREEEALGMYGEALALLETRLGDEPTDELALAELALASHQAARLHEGLGRRPAAIAVLERAVELCDALAGAGLIAQRSAMLRSSLVGLQSLGPAETASRLELICTGILELSREERDPDLRESARELAAALWTNYGRALIQALDPDRAEQALAQAQSLWRDVLGKAGLLGRARVAHWLARVEQMRGSWTQVMTILQSANSQLSGALEGKVQDTDLRIELGMNYLELANQHRLSQDHEAALLAQERGLVLFRELESERPGVEEFFAYRLGANYAYADLLLLVGRREQGFLELAQATAEHEANPLTGRLRGQLEYERAVAGYQVGSWHMSQGDVDAAEAMLLRSSDDLGRVGGLITPGQRELWAGLNQLEGLVFEARGEPDRALESYEQAEDALTELCSAAPGHEHWNLMLARARHARANVWIDQDRREEAQSHLELACRDLALATQLVGAPERLAQELFDYRFDQAAVLGHLQRPDESADRLDLAVAELADGAYLNNRYAAAQLYAQLVPMASSLQEDALVARLIESSVALLGPLCAAGALGAEMLEGDIAFDAIRWEEPFLELLEGQ